MKQNIISIGYREKHEQIGFILQPLLTYTGILENPSALLQVELYVYNIIAARCI